MVWRNVFSGIRAGFSGWVCAAGMAGMAAVSAQAQPEKPSLMTKWGATVQPEDVLPEYPRPAMTRDDWESLNGLWEFREGGEAPAAGESLPESILVPFGVESQLSGIGRGMERCWYRRTFKVPAEWTGKHVLLQFGAVDWEADVRINGHKLPTHRGGYDPFTYDITNWLNPEGDQELVVGVFDPSDGGTQPRGKQVKDPSGIWYTPTTGIWQTVWIEPVDVMYVHRLTIEPRAVTGAVRVFVQPAGTGVPRSLAVQIFDEGRVIAQTSVESKLEASLAVENAKLWSPESPHLYELRVMLQGARGENDVVRSYFAFRSVEVREDDEGVPRIMLNGQPVFQVGMLDQGFWPDGLYTAPTDEALRFDIEQAKALGFNMLRKHVKVEPQRWYYWCDKLGMLVWQDMPSGDAYIGPNDADITRSTESAEQFERELKRIVQARCMHPSIVTWVLFNEGWGQYDTARLTDVLKQLDPTRPVISTSGWSERGTGDIQDVHTYPAPRMAANDGKRASVIGEFGGLGLAVPGHMWAERNWGYQAAADGDDLTTQYEDLLASAWMQHRLFGLSAVVYTQVSDVETECNGLLTYDRAVLKVDAARVRKANRGEGPAFEPISAEPPTWRYTTTAPPEKWYEPGFDAKGWSSGKGGFGTEGTPGAQIGTEWKTADIWMRATMEFEALPEGDLWFWVHHDEDAEIYINGVKAVELKGYTTGYARVRVPDEARKALRTGANTIAVHCHQTRGGQFIDVGFVRAAKE